MKNFKALVILVFGLSLVSCEKEYYTIVPYPSYFQCSNTFSAFINTHTGWMIDDKGNIKSYENPVNWNFANSDGYIEEAQILENLSKCYQSPTYITNSDLIKYSSMVESAAKGRLSTPVSERMDAGVTAYYCYWYDESKGMYKEVLLSQTGDWSSYNTSKKAKILDSWLRSIYRWELFID
jgi:hypothetical protein